MTVALAVRRIAPGLLAEARAACSTLVVPTEDWGGGIPRHTPRVVITSIDPGDRRIPDDVCGLLEATPGVRAIVCASEPLVKPRIDLADGRVTLLSPPVDRARLIAVLRSALDVDTPLAAPSSNGSHHFEVLRRAYWLAWTQGGEAPAIQIDESAALTVLFGRGDVGDVVRRIGAANDEELAELIGQQGMIHLSRDASEWTIYWPRTDAPLWMCSPRRIPQRWDLGTMIEPEGIVRMSAFPQDQLVIGWASGAVPAGAFANIQDLVAEGGPSMFGMLTMITRDLPLLGAAIVEVR